MADDKRGRDKQAHDRARRQRERELEEALDRRGDPEPTNEGDDVAEPLASYTFPLETTELLEQEGERRVTGQTTVADLLDPQEREAFDSAEAVMSYLAERANE